jgi:hypothetical protein
MQKLIRRYLIPALVVAVTGTGVSFAATGSVVPFHHDTTLVSNTEDNSTEVQDSTESDDQNEDVAGQNQDETANEQESSDPSGPPVRSTEGCDGFTGTDGQFNHGQFVSQSEDHQPAAHSPCGKPVQSIDANKDKGDDNEAPEVEDHSGTDDQHESDQGAENEQHSQGHGSDHQGEDGGDGS